MIDRAAESMWEAVKNNDLRYDGAFFYGVSTTGIFCRPSCRSKTPSRENVRFFTNRHEAEAKGYRPCKRCRPDLLEAVFEPEKEICRQAEEILGTDYHHPVILSELPSRVGGQSFPPGTIVQETYREHPEGLAAEHPDIKGQRTAGEKRLE